MKKTFAILITAAVALTLSGCKTSGSYTEPPEFNELDFKNWTWDNFASIPESNSSSSVLSNEPENSSSTSAPSSKPVSSSFTKASSSKPASSYSAKASSSKPASSYSAKASSSKPASSYSAKASSSKPMNSSSTKASSSKPASSSSTKASSSKPASSSSAKASSSKPASSVPDKNTEPLPSTSTILVTEFSGTVHRNNDATVAIIGLPNTEYSIEVIYSSGASTAKGLENKTSDSTGAVSWTWHVGGRTKLGGGKTIKISGGGKSITLKFSVEA